MVNYTATGTVIGPGLLISETKDAVVTELKTIDNGKSLIVFVAQHSNDPRYEGFVINYS